MPRIPFTDLASAPEFKALPLEDQQTVASNYWDEVAAEQPDRAELFTGMRDASKSLFELKAKRADAAPVQRRALDAQVEGIAFDLSLGDNLAQGALTPEGYNEALKVRESDKAARQARFDKTASIFSEDPEKQKALAIRLDGLEQTATTGGVFQSLPFIASMSGMGPASKDAYEALKAQTAEDYGLEPAEVDDLIKHRLGLQEKPVSRDPLGLPHIKPEVLAQGPDAVKDAILNSDLPWSEKKRMTETGDLRERMTGYYQSKMDQVKKDHPELTGVLGLDTVEDPQAGYAALVSSLNQSGGAKLAGGFTSNILGAAEEVLPRLLAGERPGAEERTQEIRETMQPTRRAQESINQLSQELFKDQGTLWGVDMSAYGSGLGSVLTGVALGTLTGGASIPVSASRVATMGPTALRMLNGANSVMRASPMIGLAMAQTGTATYENAIKSGMSEEEAGDAATLSAATEGVITGAFSLLGAGGLESVGEQLLGTAAKQSVREASKGVFRQFGEKAVKGIAAEQFEEGLIAAFDAATVQARIDPTMTVEDFKNTLRETALVTLAVSGPTVGAGALRETLTAKPTYEKTTDEVKLEADLNLVDASTTQPGESNLPPGGERATDATADGGALAPGAPEPAAPGGTEAVVGAEPSGTEVAAEPASVPGVPTDRPAEPVLVPDDAGVTPTTTPPTNKTNGPEQTAGPDAGTRNDPQPPLQNRGLGGQRETEPNTAGGDAAVVLGGDAPTGTEVSDDGRSVNQVQAREGMTQADALDAIDAVEIDRSLPLVERIAQGEAVEKAFYSGAKIVSRTGRKLTLTGDRNGLTNDFEARTEDGKRFKVSVADLNDTVNGFTYTGEYDPKFSVLKPTEPVAPESEEPPAETFREAEPDYQQVFETLREREPATKQVNTESPKFKELVADLKNQRVAEVAGKLAQHRADIAEMRKRADDERVARDKERKKRNREREANRPLDVHQRKIKEITGHGHGYSRGIKDWLVKEGLDPSVTINKDWRRVALRENPADSQAKTGRIHAQFDKLSPKAKEVVEAFHRMSKKPAEEIPVFRKFAETEIGEKLLARPIRSLSSYRDAGEEIPVEYEGLVENRIKAHVQSRIFTRSPDAPGIAEVVDALNVKYDNGNEGSMIDTGVYTAEDIIQAINDLSEGKVKSQEDHDAYLEKQLQDSEDRVIAFAEQQLAAAEGDAQVVDITEVREGDVFTLDGVEYRAVGVQDTDGRTDSFTLRGKGPLNLTEVTEDFFAESVTPTPGSLAGVDPAEVEAFRVAQETPEAFEDTAAPTAAEPETPQSESEARPEDFKPNFTMPDETPPVEPAPAPTPPVEDDLDVTGIQNAQTDRLRVKAGLPPRFSPARLGNEAAWDAAMKRINQKKSAARELVNALKTSPRSIDPIETAMFTHELLVREQTLDEALAAFNENPTPDIDTVVKEAQASVMEAILTAEQIGTIEGRALQARKILIHQDFSFARMAAQTQKAQGGKPLSADQSKEIQELHKQLQAVQQQLAVANDQIVKAEAERVFVNVQVEFKKSLREAKKRGEKPASFIDRQAEAAKARILARKREGRLNSLPVDELLDHAIVGLSYFKNGITTLGEFTTRLVKDFGRRVLPFAGDIFAKSQELYESAAPTKKVKSREDILSAIEPEAALDSKAIFQLVRHYINEGVEGFEAVMGAVLKDLKGFYPDLTLREVHDAYSKYGQIITPSKEDDLRLAREYRALSRLQSQLEDAQRGLAPKKTGLVRDAATQRVRELTKQVKDTMRKLDIRPTTEEGQLKSSFEAIRTRLNNEIEDLVKAVADKEELKAREPQKFTPEEQKELADLRQQRDERKREYAATFGNKGLTFEQQLDKAEKLLDRRIAEERDLLRQGILQRNRDVAMGPWTPALVEKKKELDQLKADRRERQKAAKPKKPEDIKEYERQLASLDRRIKEEEELLAAGLNARQKDFKMGRWSPELAERQTRLDAMRDARRELAKSRQSVKSQEQTVYERSVRAIEAAIQRYQDIINEVSKPGKTVFSRTIDAEMQALLDQRNALRDAAAEVLEADPARRDKRKQDLLQTLYKSINEITRKIQDGDLSTKVKTGEFANDPDVTKIRASRDALNKTLAAMRREKLPKKSPEEIRESRDRKLLQGKIDKLRDRLARGDYSKPVKLPAVTYADRDALLKQKKALESEFNENLLQLELANRSFARKAFDNTTDVVFGVSRAMLTSFDAGAFGRQAGIVNFMRPGLAIKNFPANFAFREKTAATYEAKMESDPQWARAQASGLALTSWRPGSSLSDMEEVYRSRLAKKIPGVAASERAYVTYLNVVRFSYFNALADALPVVEQTETNLKRLATFVNTATGRGNLKKFEGAAAAMASVFFSPKYWWSRLQLLGGMLYHPLDALTGFRLGTKETRAARKIVAQEFGRLGISLSLVFGLLAFAKDAFDLDDEEFMIGTDPRSSDFGKVRIGDTRIDFMAGLLQNVVFIARLATGEKVTAGGEVTALSGPEAKFKETRLGETIRLLRTKLSPAAGSIANALDGADVVGNKFTPETEILGSYIPMSLAETYSSMRELGMSAGAAAGLSSFIGVGASTYGGEEDYVIEQDIFTGRILEPFGIRPGTFFIDQSRYDKETKEKGYTLPKAKPLPKF